uniref:Adenosylmethionine decarboxylase n=1 Tax=Timema monikensis TaxID=170555 RepID=A0A7R9EBI4_9NEOP|nr:unnamed protein product [Timema monikensis]
MFWCFSESSMFITQHRFILKTCGTTTPLQCLQPLLLLVEQYAGFDDVKEVYPNLHGARVENHPRHNWPGFKPGSSCHERASLLRE